MATAWSTDAQAVSAKDFEEVVDTYLAERKDPEHITGVSAYINLGDPGPAIEIFGGETSDKNGVPVSGDTLFQIGSNTKGFTGALILALEAEGKLSIDQTVGDWLPQYRAWKDVTIKRLLNMTSGLPTYSESIPLSRLWVTQPNRHYTPQELLDYAYPSKTTKLPPNSGYFYSNTNYILAGMIAEKAAGKPYKQLLEEKLFAPAKLRDTFYQPIAYPPEIIARGTEYLTVFRLTGTVAWLAYGMAVVPDAIWFGRPWSSIIKTVFDALLYALLTAGVFAWLWPAAS